MSVDEKFEKDLKHLLQAEPLDDEIKARLNAARQQALSAVNRDSQRRWLPLAAVATMAGAALITAFWLNTTSSKPQRDMLVSTDDMELLMVEEELDLLEDMEFFLWLSATAESDDDPSDEG